MTFPIFPQNFRPRLHHRLHPAKASLSRPGDAGVERGVGGRWGAGSISGGAVSPFFRSIPLLSGAPNRLGYHETFRL